LIGDICSSNPVSLESESASLKLSNEVFSVRISSSIGWNWMNHKLKYIAWN
jgi:hypothetical protein